MPAQQIPDGTFKENIKMTLTTEGHLGIGTVNPEEKLHIVGNIILGKETGFEDSNRSITHNPGTLGDLSIRGRDNIVQGAGGKIIITPGINVGTVSELSKSYIKLTNAVRLIEPNYAYSNTYTFGTTGTGFIYKQELGVGVEMSGSFSSNTLWTSKTYDRIVYVYSGNGSAGPLVTCWLGNGYGNTSGLIAVQRFTHYGCAMFYVPAGVTFAVSAAGVFSGFQLVLTIFNCGITTY